MKTLTQLNDELRSIPYIKIEGDEILQQRQQKEFNKNNKRAAFLKICIMYMERNPAQSVLEKDLARLQNKLYLINQGCNIPATEKPTKERSAFDTKSIKRYNDEAGVPLIKQQIKTLSFLLR